MQLYNDGAYDLALIELQRAYDLAPSYKLLYNVAQVNAQLSNYAGALRAFEKYLADGGADVPADRRAEVEKEIQTLRGRTANVVVKVNVPGAEILVDGLPVASPAEGQALMVNAGVRRIGVRKPGYQPAERVLTLAGGDAAEVSLEMASVTRDGPSTPPPQPPPAPKKKEPSYLWMGWVGTGVLTAGAVVTGLAALGAASDLDDELASPTADGQTPAEKAQAIDDAESSRLTLAVATDVLAGAAIVAGALTITFTIIDANDDEETASAPLTVGVRPTGLDLQGAF
jgi:tetratricopeptide (TPR) repeat protein